MDTQHCHIVKGRGVSCKGADCFLHIPEELHRGGVRCSVQSFKGLGQSELMAFIVGGFGNAVGIKEQGGTWIQFHLIFPAPEVLHTSKDKAVPVTDSPERSAGSLQHGVLMARVGCGEVPGLQVQNAEPHGDEHFFRVLLVQLLVDGLQDRARGEAGHGRVLYQDLADHHEEGGRNAFAGDVRDHKGKIVFADQEIIVEITAHFLCRMH